MTDYMNRYTVKVIREKDPTLPYHIIDISATCEESAALKALITVAETGWFPSSMSFNDCINTLIVESVTLQKTGD